MSSDVPVGIYRTYARMSPNEPFTYDNWCRALKAGRTFLSGGPMIRLSVEGADIGDTINMAKGGGVLELEASAESLFPIHTLQIVRNGQVIAQADDTRGAKRIHLRERIKVEGHAWIAARCGGPNYTPHLRHFDGWRRGIFAHTSPVYIAVGGPYHLFHPDSAEYMITLISGGLQYIRHHSRQHPEGTVTHHHGETDHLGYLERPWHEALTALHRRMHALGIPH